ncbi:MAG TPA: hypothetical protein VGD22_19000 [Sphingobacteriaceae bacterium]
MKKNISLIAILGIALFASCSKEVEEINYTPDVKIQFSEGGESNIVTASKGATTYPVKVDVTASGPVIRLFEIYSADATTGNRGALISSQAFTTPKNSHSATYTIPSLTTNQAVKVVVTDTLERTYERNILIKITPSVSFSEEVKMETVENYYGPYFASWLTGRVYMRNTTYTQEIDFSLGDVVLSGGTTKVAALVNPALRKDYKLLTVSTLKNTKYALTTLTAANYNAITKVDAAPITGLADPSLDAVAIQAGKVYLYKTADGEKGLIYVRLISAKTGKVEGVDGQWSDTPYSEVTLSAKTVLP